MTISTFNAIDDTFKKLFATIQSCEQNDRLVLDELVNLKYSFRNLISINQMLF